MVFEDEMKPPSAWYKWMMRLFRILFFISLFVISMIAVLSAVGGSNDSLRKGLEDYISDLSGHRARVGTLNYMGFFPAISVDVEDITFYDPQDTEEKNPVASVEKATFSASFWSVAFSLPGYEKVNVRSFEALPGVFTPKALKIENLAFDDDSIEGQPGLVVKGHYGTDNLELSVKMILKKTLGGKDSYRLDQDSNPFRFAIGDLVAQGTMFPAKGGGARFDFEKISKSEKLADGYVEMALGRSWWFLDADLNIGQSVFDAELELKEEITGTIRFPSLALEDVTEGGALSRFVNAIKALGPEQKEKTSGAFDVSALKLDLDVDLPHIKVKGADLGKLRFPVKALDNKVKIGPATGKITEGKVSLDAELKGGDSKGSLPSLSAKVEWHDWSYGALQKALHGMENISARADLHASLSGEGKTWEELRGTLKGEVVMIGGNGDMPGKALDLWGKGLVNIMIPDFQDNDRAQLNCVIADFKVEEGIAKPDPLFMDFKRVTVSGEGQLDLIKGTMDISLKPKSKELEIGTLTSVPVKIIGPLGAPEISASSTGLGAKLGGLLLGTINPVFLAYNLTDLGLTEKHPCYEYLKANGDKAANGGAGNVAKDVMKTEETLKEEAKEAIMAIPSEAMTKE